METVNTIESKLTADELEQLLAKKRKEEKQVKEAKRGEYENRRDEIVSSSVSKAKELHTRMKSFKEECLNMLEEFRVEANRYGDIRKNSKGGFSLRHRETQQMITLDRNVVAEYDERAKMAEDLIKDFIEDKVKKRDLQSYRTIKALIERNKAGDLTPARVADLLKVRDNYDDKRWIKAMELFEESFRIREISYSVSFFEKDAMGKDKAIVLTLSSIPVELKNTQEEE